MSATFTWVIEWMQTTPTTATPPETVITAGWRCNGAQTANSVDYTATVYGTASFTYTSGEPFTPYADLTFEQVCGWLEDAMGAERVTEMDAALDQQIENQINPPVVVLPLPWTQAAE